MKAKILIVAVSVMMMIACSKDKYETKPKLTFTKVNGESFYQGSNLQFSFEVTDKEGDIQDTMWLEKISYTCGADGYILSGNQVPDFTSRKDLLAEINIDLIYGSDFGGCTGRTDSCYFRFWIKDKAGHVSDTVESPTIKLLNE